MNIYSDKSKESFYGFPKMALLDALSAYKLEELRLRINAPGGKDSRHLVALIVLISSLTRVSIGSFSLLLRYWLRLNRPRRRIVAVLPLGLGRVKIP